MITNTDDQVLTDTQVVKWLLTQKKCMEKFGDQLEKAMGISFDHLIFREHNQEEKATIYAYFQATRRNLLKMNELVPDSWENVEIKGEDLTC